MHCGSFDSFSSSVFSSVWWSRCIHFLKKFLSHAPSPPWTANKGGNRAVMLSPGQMYQWYIRYIEWHWVHTLGHARPFSFSALHDTGCHSISCTDPIAKQVSPEPFFDIAPGLVSIRLIYPVFMTYTPKLIKIYLIKFYITHTMFYIASCRPSVIPHIITALDHDRSLPRTTNAFNRL